jgi:hypothetical protein
LDSTDFVAAPVGPSHPPCGCRYTPPLCWLEPIARRAQPCRWLEPVARRAQSSRWRSTVDHRTAMCGSWSALPRTATCGL